MTIPAIDKLRSSDVLRPGGNLCFLCSQPGVLVSTARPLLFECGACTTEWYGGTQFIVGGPVGEQMICTANNLATSWQDRD